MVTIQAPKLIDFVAVPLPDDTRAAIVNTAREVGVSEVSIQRATV